MSRSPFVVVDVPPWTARQVVPVPGHVRTVLPALSTWPRSVALKRGANVRSADAGGASAAHAAIATARPVSHRRVVRRTTPVSAHARTRPEPGANRPWLLSASNGTNIGGAERATAPAGLGTLPAGWRLFQPGGFGPSMPRIALRKRETRCAVRRAVAASAWAHPRAARRACGAVAHRRYDSSRRGRGA